MKTIPQYVKININRFNFGTMINLSEELKYDEQKDCKPVRHGVLIHGEN